MQSRKGLSDEKMLFIWDDTGQLIAYFTLGSIFGQNMFGSLGLVLQEQEVCHQCIRLACGPVVLDVSGADNVGYVAKARRGAGRLAWILP